MTHAETAKSLVCGNRNADYGSPKQDFERIAAVWTGLIGQRLSTPLSAIDVGLMMTGLKLVRHAHKPKDDNLVDAHGYLDCIEWIETSTAPRSLVPELQDKLAQHERTIEDVCTGGKLTCVKCGTLMPCMCGH